MHMSTIAMPRVTDRQPTGALSVIRGHPMANFLLLVFALTWMFQIPWIASTEGWLTFDFPLPLYSGSGKSNVSQPSVLAIHGIWNIQVSAKTRSRKLAMGWPRITLSAPVGWRSVTRGMAIVDMCIRIAPRYRLREGAATRSYGSAHPPRHGANTCDCSCRHPVAFVTRMPFS